MSQIRDELLNLENIVNEEEQIQSQLDDDFYKSHPLRYFIYLIFYLQLFFFGFLIYTYVAISKQLKKSFNIEVSTIQLSFSIALFGKLILIPFTNILMEKYGMKKLNIVAIIFIVIGCFLRYQLLTSYIYVHLGMLVNGIAGNFIQAQYIKFCFNWFSPKERGIFISLLHTSVHLGAALGQIYPQFLVGSEQQSIQELENRINFLNLQYIIMSSILLCLTLLFYKDKPPTGYGWQNSGGSICSNLHPNTKKSFKWRIKNLLTHNKFKIYIVIYALKQNFNVTYSELAILIMQEIKYPYWISGTCAITNTIIGSLSCVIYMVKFINKSQKKYLTLFLVIAFIFFNLEIIVLTRQHSFIYYIIYNIFFAFFAGPTMPIMYELIPRHVLVDDFNFTNNILVFVGVFVTAISQLSMSALYKICNNINDSFFIAQIFLIANFIVIIIYCMRLKQLILYCTYDIKNLIKNFKMIIEIVVKIPSKI